MRIALIGTGNVAWHLAQACIAAGHEVVAVVGHTARSGEEFAKLYPGTQRVDLPELKYTAIDVILIAVPDAALAGVATNLHVQPATVVAHTSGSQPLSLLSNIHRARTGVFYPVQTFTKYRHVDFTQIPVLIEGIDEETTHMLVQFGSSLSRNVQVKDSAARRQLHLAAVFACNFTNHLLGISHAMLQEAGLPTDLLHPLIQETISKAGTANPFTVQTGPAARNDKNVIQEHMQLLQAHPSWQELYQHLTQSIQEQHARTDNNRGHN